MQSPFILLLALLLSGQVFSQSALSRYVQLKAEQFEENNEKYVGVYPVVNQHPGDETGRAVLKYHRRFEYVLNNKTHFQSIYDHLYPDTVRINSLYIDSISRDKQFMTYFNSLLLPLTSQTVSRQPFSRKELMQVASRFFYCDGVKDDSSISSHICITLNGVSEAKWEKDLTLLEAFCFEAIFENYYESKEVKSRFVKNFIGYIREGESLYKNQFANKDLYLRSVRAYAFDKMERDPDLHAMLVKYHSAHQSSFSFRITD